ncbi:MAG: YcxB family protein [Clostridiaceae bacterium]
MEALLINQCAFNKEHLTEMTRAIRKTSSAIIFICSAVLLSVSLLGFFFVRDPFIAYGSLFFALFFFYFNLYISRNSVKLTMKRYMELYHTEIESELQFFDDSILSLSEQTKTESRLDYTQIKTVLRTKNLYIIRLGAQLVLLVDKYGFTKGGCADFEMLMRQKAVKAKIKF